MKQTLKRGFALLMALVLCICLLPAIQIAADAAEFEYVYDSTGKYIYNWGTREETATSLSPMAEAFYTDNYTYDVLSAYAPSSLLGLPAVCGCTGSCAPCRGACLH